MLRRLLLISCLVFLSWSQNTKLPLITDVNDGEAGSAYQHLAKLVGNWDSSPLQPTGYNVMPVPAGNRQEDGKLTDWQSKNFYYFEQMTFTAPGEAPNRGQLFQQGCYALTYEQRVYFAADSRKPLGGLSADPSVPNGFVDTLVHFENGLWLQLQYEAQPKTAYAPPTLPFPPESSVGPPVQPTAYEVSKQLSIPHGNSILATGSVRTFEGPPSFDTSSPRMPPFSLDPTIKNPALVLEAQLETVNVVKTTEFNLSSTNPGGGLTNLVFEQGNSNVTAYSTQLYIEELSDGNTQLQYIQTITMEFDLTLNPISVPTQPNGDKLEFLHITANTLVPANSETCRAVST